jgi:hypothetical protein
MENRKKPSLDELLKLMEDLSSKPFWDNEPIDASKVKGFFDDNYPDFWPNEVKRKEGLQVVEDIQIKYYQIKKVFNYKTDNLTGDPVASRIADPNLIDYWNETYKKVALISENIDTNNPILSKKDNTLEKIFFTLVENRALIETRSFIIGLYNLVDFSNKNYELLNYAYNLSNEFNGFRRTGEMLKKSRDEDSGYY